MAYVGNPIDTQNTFQSLVGKRFSGDGSTTDFTLDVAPSSTLDIEVFVGNVRQDPNSAYTVSGTTLSFTGAPPSGTNNIYVVHQAKSVGTIDPPAGATIDMNGVELILDADADTTLTADTDDQIDIKIAGTDVANITNSSSDVVITSAVQDKDIVFKGDDGGSAVTALTIDMSAAGELLQGTSAKISSNGAIANFSNHNGSASETALATSDGNEKVRCFNDGKVTIEANGSERVRIDSSGKLSTGGETAPDIAGGGLCLNGGANDQSYLTFKSSDVAHGMTSEDETDTYATFAKQSDSEGGFQIRAYAESRTEEWFEVNCQANSDIQETKSGSAKGAIVLGIGKKSGTGVNVANANGNLLTLSNYINTEFIFEANGNFHADSGSTTFDAYEDAQLARAFDLSHGRGVIESKFDKFVQYNHEKLAELKLVGRDEDGTPNSMLNVTGLQRLHNGAIWQQYEKHNQLLEAVYDLAKEAVGEEKANAILEKHEVKRLQ